MPGLGGLARERDTDVCFPGAGWADEQHVGGGVEEAAGGELVDDRGVRAGLSIEVEVLDRCRGGQASEPQPPGQTPRFGGLNLGREQSLQRRGHRQLLRRGGIQDSRELFGGGVQTQDSQVRAQLLIERGLRAGGWDFRRCHCRVFLPRAAVAHWVSSMT